VRRFACALLLALLAGGCGSTAREAAPAKCVVHVVCTKDLCERAATGAQMQRVEARLRERGDVYSLQFVSPLFAPATTASSASTTPGPQAASNELRPPQPWVWVELDDRSAPASAAAGTI
jgi:hypothetical protein